MPFDSYNTAVLILRRSGVWGISTPIVPKIGSVNNVCPVQPSLSTSESPTSSISSESPTSSGPNNDHNDHNGKPPQGNAGGQKNNHETIIIIATIVGVVVILLIILGILLWWRSRQPTQKLRRNGRISESPVLRDVPTRRNVGEFGEVYERSPPSRSRILPWDAPTSYSSYPSSGDSASPLLRNSVQVMNTSNMHHLPSPPSSATYTTTPSSFDFSDPTPSRIPLVSQSSSHGIGIDIPEKKTGELVLTMSGSFVHPSSNFSQLPAGAAPPTRTTKQYGESSRSNPVVRQIDPTSNSQELPPPYLAGPSNQSNAKQEKKKMRLETE